MLSAARLGVNVRPAFRLAHAVFAVAAFVLALRLGDPPTYVHDECYQAFTAHRYAMGDPLAWEPRADRAAMVAFSRVWAESERRVRWVYASGALFGIGMTMKGTGAPTFLVCALLAIARLVWDGWRGRRVARELAVWSLAFVVMPIVLYVGAYAP